MLDLQSSCPGGRKKKIKDCCPDLVKELDQVYIMLEGKQYSACESMIETLEKQHSDCTCLRLAKAIACRLQQKNDEALDILLSLSQKDPNNSRVLTELSLMYIIQGRSKEAISCIIDALETLELGLIENEVWDMAMILSKFLIRTSQYIPAFGLLHLLSLFEGEENNSAVQLISALYADQQIPPFLKALPIAGLSISKTALPIQFNENCMLAQRGHWKKALANFEAMTREPNVPSAIFWSIALLSLWMLDVDKGIEYLKRYIAAPDTEQDDAVDAQILVEYLQGSILNDNIRVRHLVFTVYNQEDAMEKLLSDPIFIAQEVDFSQFRDQSGSPPPQKAFLILDKPRRTILSEEANPEDFPPKILSQVFFFGKQTDREARIVLTEVPESEMMTLENKLRAVLGDDLGTLEENDDLGEISETDIKLFPSFFYQDNPKIDTEDFHKQYYEKVFFPWWLNHPLGILNGKTPLEASKMPELRIQILAAITAFEYKIQESETVVIFETKLRELLDLPKISMIENINQEDLDKAQNLEIFVPFWRWNRIDFSKLSTQTLVNAFTYAQCMAQLHIIGAKIAELILERTDMPLDNSIKNICLEMIISKSFTEGDSEQIRQALEKAYNFSIKNGTSDGRWHLLELMYCVRQKNLSRFEQLFKHLATEHRNEPDTMERLSELLKNLGLVPGGPGAEGNPMTGGMPGAAPVSPQTAKEPGGLWTPGSDNSASDQGDSGSKLWIPGND